MKRIWALLVIVVLLLGVAGVAANRAMHYRDLYMHNPRVKTVQRNSVIHDTDFDPGRAQAYKCTPQKVSSEGFGMICFSPDRNIQVSCTVAPSSPNEYFC